MRGKKIMMAPSRVPGHSPRALASIDPLPRAERPASPRLSFRLIVIVARHMPLAESGSLPISLRAVL